MRAGDPVKRFGRADKARQLAGRADAPRELSPHVARSAQFVANTVGHGSSFTFATICTRFDIRMETTALHAYKEQFVTTTSIAPCGHAQPKTLARTKDRCADV